MPHLVNDAELSPRPPQCESNVVASPRLIMCRFLTTTVEVTGVVKLCLYVMVELNVLQ